MGGQGRQTWPDVQEPLLFRYHDRILEFYGCYLFPRRVDVMGDAELRQSPADADYGYWAWRVARAVQECKDRERVQRELSR